MDRVLVGSAARRVLRIIVLAILWVIVLGVAAEYLFSRHTVRREDFIVLFWASGFLGAIHAKRHKVLWFFGGAAIAVGVIGTAGGILARYM